MRNKSGALDLTAYRAIENIKKSERNYHKSFTIDYAITGADSLNTIYAGHHWTSRKAYKDGIYQLVRHAMQVSRLQKDIAQVPVYIEILFPLDNVDIDNHAYFSKCVVDSLCGHFIQNDSPKYVKGMVQAFANRETILVTVRSIFIEQEE